jgi:hypothetical protein
MEPARRTDWNIEPMSEAPVSLEVERTFTRDELASLCFGVVPRSMDEKWFVYFEDPWLYLHRSWTGVCVYQVRLERTDAGARISEALVSRDCVQQGAASLLFLLDSVLQRNARYRNVRFLRENR